MGEHDFSPFQRAEDLRPLARHADLLTQRIDDELLVYDCVSHEAHALDPRASALWHACDGRRSVDELAAAVGVRRDEVEEALAMLEERGLLDIPRDSPGVSRRAVVERGLVAGGALGIAVGIRSVLVPTPAAAASTPATTTNQPPPPNCQPQGAGCSNGVADVCCQPYICQPDFPGSDIGTCA